MRVRKRPGEGRSARQRRRDDLIANALLVTELVLCLSLIGPQPVGWLWIGSQVQYATDAPLLGILTIILGCIASLMLTLAVAKRVDHAWKLVRRAAGHTQERGALETVFVISVAIAVVAFAFWFLIIAGPSPSLAPSG